MAQQQLENLPEEAKALPEGAQKIFAAAMNSAQSDGLSADGAKQVAWNTIKHDYEQNSDGSWQRRAQQENITNKSIQSGGN
jgi:cation transport regulator